MDALDQSMIQVRASELFPKKSLSLKDGIILDVPFSCLYYEHVEYKGTIQEDGLLVLSNYRLYLKLEDTCINIPLGLIESVESKEMFHIIVKCKDARSLQISFPTSDDCVEWHRRLIDSISLPQKLDKTFAYGFYAWCAEENPELHNTLTTDSTAISYETPEDRCFQNLKSELERLRFDTQSAWRITKCNADFGLCSSYPRYLTVPACITDDTLTHVAKFRSSRRIPAVVWRHQRNGSVIARCSQPEVGWLGWRSAQDEDLLKSIAEACAHDVLSIMNPDSSDSVGSDEDLTVESHNHCDVQKVLIVDARSYATAVANRARGGGVECTEYYPNCEIQFMNLPNIHTIRKGLLALRNTCTHTADQLTWLTQLDNSKWLQYLSLLIKAALTVVHAVDVERRPVVVHCSDGWDRTPQIVTLAELMLDPYYRTMEGFQVMVQREWLDFGHKFADRCGQGLCSDDPNERCPVFLQWLDSVYQLQHQFPTSFEFNEAYLVKLAVHTYSNLFGTFLLNTARERAERNLLEHTYSVWSYLRVNQDRFRNYLYIQRDKPLIPNCGIRDLTLWRAVYLPQSLGGPCSSSSEESSDGCMPPRARTRSCDNLNCSVKEDDTPQELMRRSSDSDIVESLRNGVESLGEETEDPNGSTVESIESREDEAPKTTLPIPIESSTDTLVADSANALNDSSSPSSRKESFSELPNDVNGNDVPVEEVAIVEVKNNSLSTSTTEISESCITLGWLDGAAKCKRLSNTTPMVNGVGPPLKCDACPPSKKALECKESLIKRQQSSERQSVYSTPAHSRSPSSGLPSTPNPPPRFELDGLPFLRDDIQKRLLQIFRMHEAEVAALRSDLYLTRQALYQQKCHKCSHSLLENNPDDSFSQADSACSGGEAQSDVGSFEAIDEREAVPTLWEPDHAVSNCGGCNTEFWIGRRKHHCRNCGRIFCGDCSSYMAPVPREQLYYPVRVCSSCYHLVNSQGCRLASATAHAPKPQVTAAST